MARKLRPHEERAFFQALPPAHVIGRLGKAHKNPLNRESALDSLDSSAPERLRNNVNTLNWDECSWPDEWGW